jgi:RNA polymerase sigma factor (sigma-70 family)
MAANDLELLGQFAREQSQDAFTTLVNRHLGLVYSAALRQVRSPHLAEEVAQTVFTNLARNAAKLTPDTNLTAWLYRVTRHAAIDVIRTEARRQAREQLSLQMSATNDSPDEWSHIEPLLDEAVDSLDEPDRTAILLRYFENKSLQEVGAALGASEDAAQKRVSRAVEQLREFFTKRKVTVGAGVLVALLSANAIQAVPAALSTTVATAAVVASTTISPAVAATTTIAIAMTTAQKILIATLIAAAIAGAAYEGLDASRLRHQVQALQQQQAQTDTIRRERDEAKTRLTQLARENDSLKQRPSDVLKLRSQVGELKRKNAQIGSKAAISLITANPETLKMLRDQARTQLGEIYSDLVKQLNLTGDAKDKFLDLLADHMMGNLNNITTALRDKPAKDQLDEEFAAEDAAFQQKVSALLGPDALARFDNYSQNLASTETAEQFKDELTGTDAEKDAKAQQLSQLMQTTIAATLASSNLPANFQMVPVLNLENFASEQQANQNLAMLEGIYQQVAAQSSSFLSPDEVASLKTFAAAAIKNYRTSLMMNRTLMAPIAQ